MMWRGHDHLTLSMVASPEQTAAQPWVAESSTSAYLDSNRAMFLPDTYFDVEYSDVQEYVHAEVTCEYQGQPFRVGVLNTPAGDAARWGVPLTASHFMVELVYTGDDLDWIRQQGIFRSQDPRGLWDPWSGRVPTAEISKVQALIEQLHLPTGENLM
ncbi:hypothetical protein ATC03_17150 [Agromyces aureus]|uniref:Uncharacterized protein n=2 Tax=Agromyces aureus TaxID=453304 RepID=A0A191WJ23_9MICO|nr:hypothetical protein ATC03_17150 [Agromyces aureus]